MTKRPKYLHGNAGHTRTEADYAAALLEACTLDDWREVVAATVAAAKGGDAQARAWLGQYLMGKPHAPAPTPLQVTVQQWSGVNPVAERLAQGIIGDAAMTDVFSTRTRELEQAISNELADKLGEQ